MNESLVGLNPYSQPFCMDNIVYYDQIPEPIIINKKKCNVQWCNQKRRLIENNQGKWCITHYSDFFGDTPFIPPKKKCCDVFRCKITKSLIEIFDGSWCKNHYNMIISLSRLYESIDQLENTDLYRHNKTGELMKIYGSEWCKTQYQEIVNGKILKTYHEQIYESHFNEKNYSKNDLFIPEIKSAKKYDNWITKTINNIIDNKPNEKSIIEPEKKIIEYKPKETLIIPLKSPKITDIVIAKPNIKIDIVPKLKNKIDITIINTNCNESCHAYDCKIYKELTEKYQGKWCDTHYGEITELRKIIGKHDGSLEEMVARFNEIKMRKFPDKGHLYRAMRLMEKFRSEK